MQDFSPKFTLLSEGRVSSHPCQPLVVSEFKFLANWVRGLGSVRFSIGVLCLTLGVPLTTSHFFSALRSLPGLQLWKRTNFFSAPVAISLPRGTSYWYLHMSPLDESGVSAVSSSTGTGQRDVGARRVQGAESRRGEVAIFTPEQEGGRGGRKVPGCCGQGHLCLHWEPHPRVCVSPRFLCLTPGTWGHRSEYLIGQVWVNACSLLT